MPLSKIQRNMLAAGSVLPENLVTTSTFTVNGLRTTLGVTATSVTATSSNITTMAGGSLALTGNASAVHVNASGNVGATAVRATTITATNTIVTNETVTNLTATNLTVQNTIPSLSFTTATGYTINLQGDAGASLNAPIITVADVYVSNAYRVNGVNGMQISGVRPNSSTNTVAFYNSSTLELTYGPLNASQVEGLATVATSGSYTDLSNKPYTPNQNVDTTSSPTFASITVLGTMTTLNVTTENVTTENIVTQNFADGTTQTTAWTGTVADSQITSVSTTKVNGLSLVGFTNNYNDLTNIPQALGTGASPTFAGLTLTTGTNVNRTVSAGGFPLNSAGTATIFTASGQSPSLVVSNYTSGLVPNIYVRGYGQNRPGGTASTAPNSNITIEGSRGTAASPTTIVAGDNLGGMTVGGFDGNNWQSDFSKAPNFFGWYATENWGFDSVTTTSTIRAGSGFNLFVQPAWTQTGINQTRQRMIFTSWTTSTTAPSQINIIMGAGVDGATGTSTHVLANGNTYVGPGRANMTYINPLTNFLGVPATDPAPENSTLTATNVINLVSNRRSGTSGRRNPILAGDSLYTLNFRGQHQPSATGIGLIGAAITTAALDNFTSTQYGTSLSISTVNTGTAVTRNRLVLTDRLMQLSADQFQFNNGGYANIPLTFTTSTWNSSIDNYTFGNTAGTVNMLQMTTSTAAFASTVAITTYNRTYGEFCYTGTTITATATNSIYAFPLNTTNVANGIVIQNSQQIKFNQVGGGFFKIIMSLQAGMSTNSVGSMDFWLRKNGNDIPNSATQVDLLKDQKAVVAMDWLVNPAAGDYYEIVYAVDDTNLNFPYTAPQTSPFIRPSIPPIIVNVIPVGA